ISPISNSNREDNGVWPTDRGGITQPGLGVPGSEEPSGIQIANPLKRIFTSQGSRQLSLSQDAAAGRRSCTLAETPGSPCSLCACRSLLLSPLRGRGDRTFVPRLQQPPDRISTEHL